MAIEESDIPVGYDFAGAAAEAAEARAAFLRSIPDDELTREYMRRHNARVPRAGVVGRKRKLRPCKFCRRKFGALEMREHLRDCKARSIHAWEPWTGRPSTFFPRGACGVCGKQKRDAVHQEVR